MKWERSWIEKRFIPETQAGKNKHIFSWMENKKLITDACTYIKAQDDSKCL